MKTLTKEQFVVALDAAGVTDKQKQQFHAALERTHPESHQHLLESLGIQPDEIQRIRSASRG